MINTPHMGWSVIQTFGVLEIQVWGRFGKVNGVNIEPMAIRIWGIGIFFEVLLAKMQCFHFWQCWPISANSYHNVCTHTQDTLKLRLDCFYYVNSPILR